MITIIESSLFSNSNDRSKSERIKTLVKKKLISDSFLNYQKDYFDGGNNFPGYGNYFYDGRYEKKVEEFISYHELNHEMNIIEFGCAKAFILFEFYKKGFKNIKGIDYSNYAINESPLEIRSLLEVGDASKYKDNIIYDVIISKEMLPHLELKNVKSFIKNLNQIANKNARIYLEIQYGETNEERNLIIEWDPTHKTLLSKDDWFSLFVDTRDDLNIEIFFKRLF